MQMKNVLHVQVVSQSPTVLASFLIAFGLLAVATPLFVAGDVVGPLSWLLMFSGVTQLVYSSCAEGDGDIASRTVLGAGLYLGAGLWLLTTPLSGLNRLVLVLVPFFFAKALMDITTYFPAPKRLGAFWVLFGGFITMSLSVMIWCGWPTSATWALAVLAGISMAVTGAVRLLLALASGRAAQKRRSS